MNTKISQAMANLQETNTEKVQEEEMIKDDFKIEQLFGSKTRVRLLGLFLEDSDRSFYVRELTRRIDAQLNSVRRELSNLVGMGILLEVEGKILDQEKDGDDVKKSSARKAKKKFYKANPNFLFFDELRNIMKKSSVVMNRSIVRELSKKGNIDLLLMTGKFIDDDSVPSDLLIVGDINVKTLQKTIAEFEKQIGWEINYTYMPRDEYSYRKEVKDRFLSSIMSTERIVLIDTLQEEV